MSSDENGSSFQRSIIIKAAFGGWVGGGGGGEVSPRKSVLQSACQYDVTSRVNRVTFKMASKVCIEETDKNFDFITEILFRFLGFGDFKVSIVTEN